VRPGEGAGGGGQSQQNTDVDAVYDVGKLGGPGQPPTSYPVGGLSEVTLSCGKICAIVGEQAHHVDNPDPFSGSLFR